MVYPFSIIDKVILCNNFLLQGNGKSRKRQSLSGFGCIYNVKYGRLRNECKLLRNVFVERLSNENNIKLSFNFTIMVFLAKYCKHYLRMQNNPVNYVEKLSILHWK